MKKYIINFFIVIAFVSGIAYSQSRSIVNEEYQFYFEPSAEFRINEVIESSNKIAVVYKISMKINDLTVGIDSIHISILAFKWEEIKKLSDFVYNMEKELTILNLPDRVGNYEEYDSIYFDAKIGRYKNDEFYHIVYFLRTKDETHIYNFTYLIDLKIPNHLFNETAEIIMKNIAESFVPVRESSTKNSD